MASRIFANASSSVSPSDQQPGKAGTETLMPSSLRCSVTLYFMATSSSASLPVRLFRRKQGLRVWLLQGLVRLWISHVGKVGWNCCSKWPIITLECSDILGNVLQPLEPFLDAPRCGENFT